MSEKNLKQVDSIIAELKNSVGKLFALAGLLAGGVVAVVKFVDTKPWHVIAIVVFVLSIFAVVVMRIYRRRQQTAWKNQFADISGSAFRGLLPYEEGDSETFFGRETDIGAILQMVRYSEFRFGVLSGESGCGKTSLLRAGLISKLQEADYLPVYLRLYGDPEAQIRQAVGNKTSVRREAGEALQAYLQRICQEKQQTLVLICDQFEEFFINHPDATTRQPFIEFVGRCYHEQTLAVKFLFSLREDFLTKISEFDGVIPETLAANTRYHLKNFDSNQAESIIQRSVDKAGLPFESGLSNTIAEDLVKENQVLPTELQIVCQQLQQQLIYSTEQYQHSGGKESLVYAFLENVIKGAGSERDVKLILRSMISEEDTKLTQTLAQITKNSQQSESQVEKILHHFVDARLIREIQEQTPWHYELMHEYLIGRINALSGSVMDAVKRANHIFKQWLNRYQRDNKTLISFADSKFIYNYSDLDRNGTAGELLTKSLRRGWLKIGMLTCAGLISMAAAGWYFWDEINKRDRNIGTLAINNAMNAVLSLQRIRHYWRDEEKRETIFENVTGNDIEMFLEGPADYLLSAGFYNQSVAYPVYIDGYDHTISVTITQPPDPKDIPAEMAYIPAGVFRMGDKVAKDGLDGNAPAHDVYLDAYLIDKTEVSNADFGKFIAEGGYESDKLWKAENQENQAGLKFLADLEKPKRPRYWNDDNYNQDKHPVVGVSWFEARAYCRWKNKKLPTEAQWEKAARGPEGYEWSFGNIWDETKANSGSDQDGYEKIAPVKPKKYPANSYGLYNMSGNVWEWVQDAYEYDFYTSREDGVANPKNDQKVGSRVLRGGSWYDDPEILRASFRSRGGSVDRYSDTGFLCARTL